MPVKKLYAVESASLPPVIRHRDLACGLHNAAEFYSGSNTDPSFVPVQGHGKAGSEAKFICGHCPHAHECAIWAIRTRQPYGIWGGLNVTERERIYARGYYQGEWIDNEAP